MNAHTKDNLVLVGIVFLFGIWVLLDKISHRKERY